MQLLTSILLLVAFVLFVELVLGENEADGTNFAAASWRLGGLGLAGSRRLDTTEDVPPREVEEAPERVPLLPVRAVLRSRGSPGSPRRDEPA